MGAFGDVLAVIPARGGSKGVPDKNICPVGGKPLLAYSVEQALAARSVSRVVVSTDSARIASVARRWRAEVVHRPESLSGDGAPSESALLHCLDHLQSSENYHPDIVVFLQATSPLREPSDIDRAVETLVEQGADSLFSGFRLHTFVWRSDDEGVRPLNYDPGTRPRRQEGPEDLGENGSIYVFKPWVLRERSCRLGGRVAVYLMSNLDSLQIDEIDDIPVAEFLLRTRHAGQVGNHDRG